MNLSAQTDSTENWQFTTFTARHLGQVDSLMTWRSQANGNCSKISLESWRCPEKSNQSTHFWQLNLTKTVLQETN